MTKTWAIILAAGREQQLESGADSLFLGVGSKPLLAYSLMALQECVDVDRVVVCAPPGREEAVRMVAQRYGCSKLKAVPTGGATMSSILPIALAAFEEDVRWVVIQELCRPCITSARTSTVVRTARRTGNAVAAGASREVCYLAESKDRFRRLGSGAVVEVRSPRAYTRDVLESAVEAARRRRARWTDEVEIVEREVERLHFVDSGGVDVRIRTADDLALAASFLR